MKTTGAYLFKKILPYLLVIAAAVTVWPPTGGCEDEISPGLVDITAASGVTFVHGFGDDELSNIVETTGAGVCLFDFDNDRDLDIYFVNGAYLESVSHPKGRFQAGKLRNMLFRNDGDNRFTDVTDRSGTGDTGFGMGCVSADYDNDGDRDLFVTNYGANVLYRNNGDGTFTDVTTAAGLKDHIWSVGCTFFDYDRDGNLDLYVGNYLKFDPEYRYFYAGNAFPGPLSYRGEPDVLYRGRGDGTFEDVTRAAGVFNPEGRAMGVASCDIDQDGYMDIFVANDAMENYLYRNNHDGTFTNIALETGTGFSQNGEATSAMGPEFGDFDSDGLIDLLVPDMSYSCLYHNTGQAVFSDMSAKVGLAAASGQYTSWSGNFFDFDNDGLLDIFITNGDSRFLEPEEDILLRNTGRMRFNDISKRLGPDFQEKFIGRGSAVGDLDADGDLDIVIQNLNARPRILKNDGGNRNNWLMVRLEATTGNRDGYGATVKLTADGATQSRYVVSSSGYLSQSGGPVHFGLGKAKKVQSLTVRWPDGKEQTVKNIPVNQVLIVTEGLSN